MRPGSQSLDEASDDAGRVGILDAAARGESLSFVISEADRFEHTGWSVVVSGKLAVCNASEALAGAALRPWARADEHHFVALSLGVISGRRLVGWGFAP